ncbi:MAG: hypothetical protein GKR97_21020, partial [Rhizobiaceae bacterium]|nr:hypothetical protein [Rhizobiaceae bacterium]
MATDQNDNNNSIIDLEARLSPEERDEALIELAQTTTDDVEPVDADPEQPENLAEQNAIPAEVTPDADNVVRLPETASVENFEVVGNDLVLRQPDGSLITITGGALKIPTFFLGDVELPSGVVVAALQTSGINVAAGPDGALAVVTDSSGINAETPVPGIGDAEPVVDTLPYTAMAFPDRERRELFEAPEEEEEENNPILVSATSVTAPDERAREEGIDPTPTQTPGSAESADPLVERSTAETSSTGTISVSAPDGIALVRIISENGNSIELNGPIPPGEPIVLVNTFGDLVITSWNQETGEITYQYTVTQAVDHPLVNPANPEDDVVFDPFTVEVEDTNGDMASTVFNVGIQDDEPIAVDDVDSIPSGEFGPVTGNLITDDSPGDSGDGDDGEDTTGADGATVTSIVATTAGGSSAPVSTDTVIQGEYGVLTVSDDGSYSYTRDPNTPGGVTDEFTYTLEDGDHDTDTAVLSIEIANGIPGIEGLNPKAQGGDTSVDEDDLLAGRGAGESEGSDRSDSTTMGDFFTISSPDGIHSLAIGGTAFITEDVFTAGSITTPLGNTLTIISYDSGTGEIAYSYTLNDNTETHPTADGENDIFEDFAVVLTDQDLQEANDILSVQVVDDVPTANDDGTIAVGEDMPVKIDALFNDVFGADGVDTDNNPDIVVSVTSQGSKGTTTYDPVTGLFTYTPFALEVGADNFTYTIIDGDGDESTATVDLMLAPDSTPMIGDPSNVEVDEDGFRFANKDTTPPQTNETTSTESLTGAGEVKVKFGNDVPDPADLLTSIVLKTTGLDAQMLMTLDMQLIEFAPDGDDIVGSVANPTSFGTTEVIRIEITGATLTDAATGEVTYTYLITLAQPIKHDAGNGENFETLFGIPFEVTDSDGSMAIGSFNAVVYDDVPVLLDQGPATVDVHEDALDQTAGTAAGNNPDDDDSTGNLEAGKTDSAVF